MPTLFDDQPDPRPDAVIAPGAVWLPGFLDLAAARGLGRRWRRGASSSNTAIEYAPDAALANYYDADARMGMHQDRDEVSRAPVVSLSIGGSDQHHAARDGAGVARCATPAGEWGGRIGGCRRRPARNTLDP